MGGGIQSGTPRIAFLEELTISGLSSGEGVIANLQDRKGKNDELIPAEKRKIVYEPELVRMFTAASRKDSVLSAVTRDLWDANNVLRVLTRMNPLEARDPHVNIVGHSTVAEVNKSITDLDARNGVANRFMTVYVDRARYLPDGGTLSEAGYAKLGEHLCQVFDRAKAIEEVARSSEFSELWREFYASNDVEDDDLAADLTARADAQTLRLALVYALADGSALLQAEHFHAATACWRYVEASTRFIFGEKLGDPEAQKLLDAARQCYPDGLDGEAQDQVLSGRNVKSVRDELVRRGLLREEISKLGKRGRPNVTVYAVSSLASCGKNGLNQSLCSDLNKSVFSATDSTQGEIDSAIPGQQEVLRF